MLDDKGVVLTIGNHTALVNGVEVALESPAKIIKSRTFVPIRFISEAPGRTVNYDAKRKIINIY